MSVLLIGANSDTFTHGFRLNKKQLKRYRIKRLQQQQYREELEEQIKEKERKRSEEKEIEKWMELKWEEKYCKDVWRRQREYGQEMLRKHVREGKKQENQKQIQVGNNLSYVSQKPLKEQYFKLPPITVPQPFSHHPQAKQNSYLDTFHTPQKNSRQHNYHQPRRLKTEQQMHHSEQISQTFEQQQNPELQLQYLTDYQNKKINEVYQLLQQSVDIFNASPEPLQRNHHRHRSLSLSSAEQNDFLRLPSTSNYIKPRDPYLNQQEREWRAWYARQKLYELTSYLKKQKMSTEIQERLYHGRRPTPHFIGKNGNDSFDQY